MALARKPQEQSASAIETELVGGYVLLTRMRGHMSRNLAEQQFEGFRVSLVGTSSPHWIIEQLELTGFDPGAVALPRIFRISADGCTQHRVIDGARRCITHSPREFLPLLSLPIEKNLSVGLLGCVAVLALAGCGEQAASGSSSPTASAGSAGASVSGAAGLGGAPGVGGAPSVGGASAGASGPGAGSSGESSTPGGGSPASGPLICSGPAPAVSDEVIGWAAVAADGVERTTGGLGGDTVRPTTAEELAGYAASAAPLIIEIDGSLSVGTLDVTSNKTLLGLGSAATLKGGLRIRPLESSDPEVSNVIVRNLRIDAATSSPDDGGDGVHIERAHHVWIDHCEIWDASDGNTDVTHGSSFITVSWTKYYYTAAAPKQDHRFSNLIGHSENATETDRGRLKVTYHHNHWGEGIEQRMPRVRFGDVHVFNNYVKAPGAIATVAAGTEAKLLVENNHFEDVNDAHFFHEGSTTAQIVASGNAYVNVTGKRDTGQGSAFAPPYAYDLDEVAQVPCDVSQGAGPR